MTTKICPRCQTRYTISRHSGDFIHDCSVASSEALKNEDVIVVGPYEDYTTTGQTAVKQGDIVFAGINNKLWGTRAAVEGETFEDVTSRGKRKSLHRTRTHLQYIETHSNY